MINFHLHEARKARMQDMDPPKQIEPSKAEDKLEPAPNAMSLKALRSIERLKAYKALKAKRS
jgi:hypothetical protein